MAKRAFSCADFQVVGVITPDIHALRQEELVIQEADLESSEKTDASREV